MVGLTDMRRWIVKACIIYLFLCSVALICSGQRKVRQFVEPNDPQNLSPTPISATDLPQTLSPHPLPPAPASAVPVMARESQNIDQQLQLRIAPRVIFHDGLLTVEALDSTLSSVVEAVHLQSGIRFEGAEGAHDRVVVKLGPAPPVDVLSDLFRGSDFGYVMLGSANAPNAIEKVIMIPFSREPSTSHPATPAMAFQEQSPSPFVRRGQRFVPQQGEPPAEQPSIPAQAQANSLSEQSSFALPQQSGRPQPSAPAPILTGRPND
jgi:hypothetical protein